MDKLSRDSSLHAIVSATNEVIDTINSYMSILKTLDNSTLGNHVSYISTPDAAVTGEVFTVQIPGVYTINSSGSGVTSVLIQRSNDEEVSETIKLFSDQQSEEILLTANDKLLFYVSSFIGNYTVSLVLRKGLFIVTQEMLSYLKNNEVKMERLSEQISSSIDAYTEVYKEILESTIELRSYVEEQMREVIGGIQDLYTRVQALEEKSNS